MSRDLLPPNATPQERALSESMARLSDVPTPVRDIWNPDTCPAELLPWLAWALSVDHWDPAWSEDRKRAVIKASITVHRHKGTPGAVEQLLEALGFTSTVLENWEYGGDPYKFKISVGSLLASSAAFDAVIAAVQQAKNTRSHLDAIVVPAGDSAEVSAGGLAAVGNNIVASIRASVALDQMPARAGGIARMGIRIGATLPSPFVAAEAMAQYATGLVRWARPITVGV